MSDEIKPLSVEDSAKLVNAYVKYNFQLHDLIRKAELVLSTARPASKTSKQSMVLTLTLQELLLEADKAQKLLAEKL